MAEILLKKIKLKLFCLKSFLISFYCVCEGVEVPKVTFMSSEIHWKQL